MPNVVIGGFIPVCSRQSVLLERQISNKVNACSMSSTTLLNVMTTSAEPRLSGTIMTSANKLLMGHFIY